MSEQPEAESADTYPAPEHGWTCFHCGETFLHEIVARAHFGSLPNCEAACRIKGSEERGLVRRLRATEDERQSLFLAKTKAEKHLAEMDAEIARLILLLSTAEADRKKAVAEERERAAKIAERYAEENKQAKIRASKRASRLRGLPFAADQIALAEDGALELDAAEREATAIASAIRSQP